MKPEKTKLGKLEMQLLAYAQLRETDLLTSGQVASARDVSPHPEQRRTDSPVLVPCNS